MSCCFGAGVSLPRLLVVLVFLVPEEGNPRVLEYRKRWKLQPITDYKKPIKEEEEHGLGMENVPAYLLLFMLDILGSSL